MPNVAELVFNDGKYGWSESYFDNNDENSQNLTETAAKVLADLRVAMLAGPSSGTPVVQPVLDYVTIATVGVDRITRTLKFNSVQAYSSIKNQGIPASASPDNPYSAVGVTFSLQNGHKSPRAFSGVPDGAITDQDEIRSQTGFYGALETLIAYLVQNGGPWGALTYAPSPQPTNNITAIAQGADGRPTITPTNPIAQPAGDCSIKVVIAGYKGEPGTPSLNGIHTGMVMGNDIKLNGVQKPLKPLCMGYVWLYVPAWSKFISGVITGPRKKSRGRPSRLPRGRSRPRR